MVGSVMYAMFGWKEINGKEGEGLEGSHCLVLDTKRRGKWWRKLLDILNNTNPSSNRKIWKEIPSIFPSFFNVIQIHSYGTNTSTLWLSVVLSYLYDWYDLVELREVLVYEAD